MHMADALVSPTVGGAMLAATAAVAAYSAGQIKMQTLDHKIPLMGVAGSFVFAAQMINFTIPVTGSSGHLGGGMLLAALLGPHAGFLTMAAVLLIQALFFGDGGLLAYGCNVINLGFIPCFVAYPLIYRTLTRRGLSSKVLFRAALFSAVIALQLGSAGVVLETLLSGKTELPFAAFFLLMQPIHLAIGIVEGLITAAVLRFLWGARPELLEESLRQQESNRGRSIRSVTAAFLVAALLLGGLFSWYASEYPDGLEWSIQRVTGSEELEEPGGAMHQMAAKLQSITAVLPDYQLPGDRDGSRVESAAVGIAGGIMTLVLTTAIGLLVRKFSRNKSRQSLGNRIEREDG